MANKKYYETMYIVRPDIGEEELTKIQDKIDAAIASNEGEIIKSKKWAERNLAYKINNITKGIYYLTVYSALPDVVVGIEKVLRAAPTDVLRFVTVNIDENAALKGSQKSAPISGSTDAPEKKSKKKKNLIVKRKYGRVQIDKLTPEEIDYKNVELLEHFITERKKIVPKRSSRLNAYGQRLLSKAIKRARNIALLPFTILHN